MSILLNIKFRIADQDMTSKVGDETVILQVTTGMYYGLDPVGTRLWELIKQGQLAADACVQITREFDVALEVVEEDARRFLAELKDRGLMVEA